MKWAHSTSLDSHWTQVYKTYRHGLYGRFALVDFGLAQRLIKAESTEHQPEVSDTTSQLNAHNSLIAKQVTAYTF